MFVIPNAISRFLDDLIKDKTPVVVGVSGGADSLYLTFLLAEWTKRYGCPLMAVTVDHGLRKESTKEAKQVHQLLKKQGISHTVLTWKGSKPKTRVEELAREKRYELLLDFCKKHKAKVLCLAHHQSDQMETFLSRLARGSGLDGLTAMHPVSIRNGILLVRPLLNTSKIDIIKALKSASIKWMEDPMNQNTVYERVRWRQLLPELASTGLNGDAVAVTTHRLQRAQQALDFYTNSFLIHQCHASDWGYFSMPKAFFEQLPTEIRVRSLMRVLMWMSPTGKMISLDGVEKIALSMPKHATLGGCQWVMTKSDIFIAPELKYVPKQAKIAAGQWMNWGQMRLWTNCGFKMVPGAPQTRLKGIPFLIQRIFPVIPKDYHIVSRSKLSVKEQKGLEKTAKKGYKKQNKIVMIELIKQKDKQ